MTQPYIIVSRTSSLKHPKFELEGTARPVVRFEDVLPKAAPCVVYAPIDLDGQVGVLLNVFLEIYEVVRLVVQLAGRFYAEYGGDLRHSLRA